MPAQEKGEQGEDVNEPFRPAPGRVCTSPICIGGTGFAQDGVVWIVHSFGAV